MWQCASQAFAGGEKTGLRVAQSGALHIGMFVITVC